MKITQHKSHQTTYQTTPSGRKSSGGAISATGTSATVSSATAVLGGGHVKLRTYDITQIITQLNRLGWLLLCRDREVVR